jgi:uncharacterized membrane protein YcaP (DUF421 family)
MSLFKSFTLTWWQVGVFKLGMLALGIAIGAFWHDLFTSYLPALVVLAVLSLIYVTVVWLRQTNDGSSHTA